MDTASLRQRLMRIMYTHSSVFAASISMHGFSCARCGWCCRENFKIRITKDISRPSNAISVFPLDIRRIIKGTGLHWDEIAEPDFYSCLDDGKNIRAIGWILRRSDKDECIFYMSGGCNTCSFLCSRKTKRSQSNLLLISGRRKYNVLYTIVLITTNPIIEHAIHSKTRRI